MQIFIKNKRTTVYEINKLDTIEFLQDQIYDKEGIPSKYYYLVHNGKILDSNKTIGFYSIERESTIYLNIKLYAH
jgi:hypothetical protein